MSQHISLLDECLAAVGTAVRSFVRVGSTVGHEMALAHEVLGAQITAEGTLSIAALVVGAHVEEEIAFEGEALAALGAHEWTLTSVTTHVIHQVFL